MKFPAFYIIRQRFVLFRGKSLNPDEGLIADATVNGLTIKIRRDRPPRLRTFKDSVRGNIVELSHRSADRN